MQHNISGFEKTNIRINSDLFIFFIDDQDDRMRYLNSSDISKININDYHKYTNRLINEYKYSIEQYNNIHEVSLNNNYESSLILNTHFVNNIKTIAKGDIVFSLPARNRLLFTNKDNKEGIYQLMKQTIKYFEKEDYPISKNIYIFSNSIFIPYDPHFTATN